MSNFVDRDVEYMDRAQYGGTTDKQLLKYKTNNYDISYGYVDYSIETTLEIELYRKYLYKGYISYYLELCREHDVVINPDDKKRNARILQDIISYYIFNKTDSDDVFFSKNPDYDIAYIAHLLDKNIKSDKRQKTKIQFNKVLEKLSVAVKESYDKLYDFSKHDYKFYTVTMRKKNDRYILQLSRVNIISSDSNIVSDNTSNNTNDNMSDNTDTNNDIAKVLKKYADEYVIPIPLYSHLYNLYASTLTYGASVQNNIATNDRAKYVKTTLSSDQIETMHKWIYMLYTRYSAMSSGGNQASVIPSFKSLLKKNLNIKIELFGSAINTSASRYGSIFYDIEKKFGSIGSFFDMKIKSGYFEANPPFEFSIIDKMFEKMHTALSETNMGLLFFIILPKMKLDRSNNYLRLKNDKYVKYHTCISKENFPYIYYGANFTDTKFRSIVDTNLIILHNDYIKPVIKHIVNNFYNYLSAWVKKMNKEIIKCGDN